MDADPRWYETFFDEVWTEHLAHRMDERAVADVDFIVEALKLGPNAHVLDLACGPGRHALELARRGYRVTGLDISDHVLAHARDSAARESLPIDLIRGDMREIPYEAGLDAVINVWTAFGYFEDEENQRTLDGIARALVPGGAFFLETIHPIGLFARFRPHDWELLADGTYLIEDRRYDVPSGRGQTTWTFVRPDGRRVERTFSVRMYTLPELLPMLRRADLELEQIWGGWDGSELTAESHRLLVLARKPS